MLCPMTTPYDPTDPAQALASLRFIWGATILGQVIVVAVVWSITDPADHDPANADLFFYAAVAALIALIPMGYFIRNQVYKANWVGHAITPAGYTRGNIVLFAMTEVPTLVAIVGMLIAADKVRPLVVFGIAVAVLLANFPTGKPMHETQPTPSDE